MSNRDKKVEYKYHQTQIVALQWFVDQNCTASVTKQRSKNELYTKFAQFCRKLICALCSRVAEVVGGTRGLCQKVWTQTKILSPNIRYFFCNIKICRDLRTFWKSSGKKSAFLGQRQCFLGKKCTITLYILHIILSWVCKFGITRKNDTFVAKIVNTCLTKIFTDIFAFDEKLPNSATLLCSTQEV